MMNKRIFLRLTACLLGGVFLASCIYRHYEEDEDEKAGAQQPEYAGFSLNLKLTLDHMGGTRASTSSELLEFENYIDPEKCRVLFFDNQDRFLFESKSRWVKQINAALNTEQWLVSVPMYAYGNDVEEKWRWQQIRDVLTKEEDENGVSFKIAILANRPSVEVYPDLETDDDGTVERFASTFDNSGPHWGVTDTRFGGTLDENGNNPKCKKIFDLHHSQEDPIYRDKGDPTQNVNGSKIYWTKITGLEHFYDFVMGHENGKRLMSSTSSWVDYGTNNADDSPRNRIGDGTVRRAARKADTSYPIPMYGIQSFGRIENWIEGVPFNLSSFTASNDPDETYEYKSISLLRSVVKLELVIPKKTMSGADVKIQYISLQYANPYARCEPMDVWTPTDELWETGHRHDDRTKENDCEWFTIQKYSRLVKSSSDESWVKVTDGSGKFNLQSTTPAVNQDDRDNLLQYHRRLGWFYGAWLEKGWNFQNRPEEGYNGSKDDPNMQKDIEDIVNNRKNSGVEPPRIFNPCIQRNQYMLLDEENCYDFGDDNYHYIVYCGERNSIDPNFLYYLDNTGTIRPTFCFWFVAINDQLYGLPLMKYENNSSLADQIKRTYTYEACTESNIPLKKTQENPMWVREAPTYPATLVDLSNDNPDLLPWALMRNHHYTITIGGITRAAANDNGLGFSVRSEVNYSETLTPSPLPATPADKDRK